MSDPTTGLYQPQPRQLVLRELVQRSRKRLNALDDDALTALLEDALFHERARLDRAKPADGERERLERLAAALVRGGREERLDAAIAVIMAWGDEIHGRFSQRVYRFATGAMPTALTWLMTQRPRHLRDLDLTSGRLRILGDVEFIRELAGEATLILAPTHVSNLDSPLIGLALHLAGLPPFVYGAGLNLFSNPVMGWFLRRLGAYTVDRTKRAALYKEVLKDYSIRCLTTRHHSLFFPGGTRARSGALERGLKKGLLGTGITAWQEMLAAGRPDPEIYVVPLTLSFQLVLEANTLIGDHLAEAGKQRYIITDDEFAEPRTVANFARRVLDLDDSVAAHFGAPMDCLGNPVPRDPAERRELAERRRRYVCDRDGKVEWDEQRDHQYTERIAHALVDAYPKGVVVMATHLVAFAAWRCLEDRIGSRDPFRLVQVPELARHFARREILERVATLKKQVDQAVADGHYFSELPGTPEEVLTQGLDRFACYHRSFALVARGADLVIEDPRLCLFYRNRLAHLTPGTPGALEA